MKTNTQLQVDVMEELQYEPIIEAAGIGITAKDGIVTLTGTVKSLSEKWAAIHAAERIGGVKAVVNQIRVEVPEMHLRSDEDIARAVVNVLNWDVMVPDEKIKVDVHEGWIILEGIVDFKHERKAAENAIRNITGVKGVTNLINLKPEIVATEARTA
jgi:osmotically-inducible protein OsmY